MRYLTDLGVKLDEVVVLAVLTELGAPTMGEFTRDGFISGWQNHRYVLHVLHTKPHQLQAHATTNHVPESIVPRASPSNKAK